MSKYTKEEVRSMAQEYLEAHAQQDQRCLLVQMTIAVTLNIDPNEVHEMIVALAND